MDKKNKPLFMITSCPYVVYKDKYVVNGNEIIIKLDDFEKEMLFNTDISVEDSPKNGVEAQYVGMNYVGIKNMKGDA